jgi:penicillin V acylase-like amidase (Ntn superfamily)
MRNNMKYSIELNCLNNGRKFLNYWDDENGQDVVCEIINGKLMIEEKEISFMDFVQLVERKTNE